MFYSLHIIYFIDWRLYKKFVLMINKWNLKSFIFLTLLSFFKIKFKHSPISQNIAISPTYTMQNPKTYFINYFQTLPFQNYISDININITMDFSGLWKQNSIQSQCSCHHP